MSHPRNWAVRPLSGGRMAVTRYLGKSPLATVPSQVDGCPVTHMDAHCFAGWTPVRPADELQVALPASLRTVDPRAFDGCIHLTAFDVAPENRRFAAWEGLLCDHARTRLVRFPPGLGGWYIHLPPTVTAIAPRAFAGSAIRAFLPEDDDDARAAMRRWPPVGPRILWPAGLRDVSPHAFDDCRDLRLILLPRP